MRVILIIPVLCLCLFAPIEPFPRIGRNPILENTIKIFKDHKPKAILSDTQLFADPEVCQTTECQNAGKLIKANLKPSVDPCDDFYEFACGGWLDTHELGNKSYIDTSSTGIDAQIRKNINESLSKLSDKSGPKSMQFASTLYKSCMDITTRKEVGVKPTTAILKSIGGWPIATGTFDEKSFDWQDALAKMVVAIGGTTIFSATVDSDANDTKVNRFQFNGHDWSIDPAQLKDQAKFPNEIKAYKQQILKVALAVGAKNDSKTEEQIDEMVDFEAKLANVTVPFDGSRDPFKYYHRMTFKAFNELSDNRVDWIQFLNNIYSKLNSSVRIRSDELVIVSDLDYHKLAPAIVESTSKRTLANFIGLAVAKYLGSFTKHAYKAVYKESIKQIDDVDENDEDQDDDFEFFALPEKNPWEDCVVMTAYSMSMVVSRLFVERSFSKKDKEVSTVLVKDIKDSFDDLLRGNKWLDSTTKDKALKKLNAIIQNVGYPDWILNDTLLDQHFNLTSKADPKDFVGNILYLMRSSNARFFDSIREKPDFSSTWAMAAYIVNAAYIPTKNSITIPAGFLSPPYFNSKLPAQINYGAIGLVIGHELTHAFDDEGSQFDLNGNLRNWWTEEASKIYNKRAECFIDEYNDILDLQTNTTLNGNTTVGENIADNGGISEAFNAYLKYVKRHGQQSLPSINNYSPEQQFFLSYANIQCAKYKTDLLKQQIKYNPHSPNKYRVNVPLSNFKTFSELFKCSPNSRMNRKDKCVLW